MDIRRRLVAALLIVLVFIFAAVAGYRLLGHDISFLQALYMAVITLAGGSSRVMTATPASVRYWINRVASAVVVVVAMLTLLTLGSIQ